MDDVELPIDLSFGRLESDGSDAERGSLPEGDVTVLVEVDVLAGGGRGHFTADEGPFVVVEEDGAHGEDGFVVAHL